VFGALQDQQQSNGRGDGLLLVHVTATYKQHSKAARAMVQLQAHFVWALGCQVGLQISWLVAECLWEQPPRAA
jgi:hypothetical protein